MKPLFKLCIIIRFTLWHNDCELHNSVDLLCDTTAAELHNSVNLLCGLPMAAELHNSVDLLFDTKAVELNLV